MVRTGPGQVPDFIPSDFRKGNCPGQEKGGGVKIESESPRLHGVVATSHPSLDGIPFGGAEKTAVKQKDII